jgi:hypothetical protein
VYKACFLPADEQRVNEPEFATEDQAWSYIYSMMCDSCCATREQALAMKAADITPDWWITEAPPCSAEWTVIDKGFRF